MGKHKVTAIMMLTSCWAAYAEEIPPAGVLQCEQNYFTMIPVANKPDHQLMVAGASCTLKEDPKWSMTFHTSVEYNPQGEGDLVEGGGFWSAENATGGAFKNLDADWLLHMDQGQLAGWESEGICMVTAGSEAGQKIYWQAQPTGTSTMDISYQFK